MRYRVIVTGIIAGLFMGILAGPMQGVDKLGAQETEAISISGRLVLESREKGDRLVLYSKDRKVYVIRGVFRGILESLLSDLGENNLVSVTGILREGSDISCKTKFGFGKQGNKTIDTQCIRYYHLRVTQINDAKKSDEEIPPPERDTAEEARTRQSALTRIDKKFISDLVIRSIQGKISSFNLRAPIKTIEVSFRDKDNQLINKVLLLTSESRIVKKTTEGEKPLFLDFNSLRVGQEVYVEYSEDEYKPEALFITIIKE